VSSPWVLILASQGSQHDLPGLRHHSVGVSVTSADDRIGPEAAGSSRPSGSNSPNRSKVCGRQAVATE